MFQAVVNFPARAGAILSRPADTWVKIKNETTTVNKLFTTYAIVLAAVPAAAHFVGDVLVGRKRPATDVLFKMNIIEALPYALLIYIGALMTVFALALGVDAAAPLFSSKKNRISSMKLVVFSITPVWLVKAVGIAPFLTATNTAWIPDTIGGVYGIYLLSLGLAAELMETPRRKILSYTITIAAMAGILMLIMKQVLGYLNSFLAIFYMLSLS